MPASIGTKQQYADLHKLARNLYSGMPARLPEYLIWMYVDDIVDKIQQLPLSEEIIHGASTHDFCQRIFTDLVDFSLSRVAETRMIVHAVPSEAAADIVQQLIAHSPDVALAVWKKIVHGYIQKCHLFGVTPDESHLHFFR